VHAGPAPTTPTPARCDAAWCRTSPRAGGVVRAIPAPGAAARERLGQQHRIEHVEPAFELAVAGLIADELSLLRPECFGHGPAPVLAMTRYRAPLARAIASIDAETGDLHLRFDEAERAIAPGQLVALYDTSSDEVLAAATIREAA